MYMAKSTHRLIIPDEIVMNKIYLIRGQKVMLVRPVIRAGSIGIWLNYMT